MRTSMVLACLALLAPTLRAPSYQETFPLHHALQQGGQKKKIEHLVLKLKADINELDEHGKTPLEYALTPGPRERAGGPRWAVIFLLTHGAAPYKLTWEGFERLSGEIHLWTQYSKPRILVSKNQLRCMYEVLQMELAVQMQQLQHPLLPDLLNIVASYVPVEIYVKRNSKCEKHSGSSQKNLGMLAIKAAHEIARFKKPNSVKKCCRCTIL